MGDEDEGDTIRLVGDVLTGWADVALVAAPVAARGWFLLAWKTIKFMELCFPVFSESNGTICSWQC